VTDIAEHRVVVGDVMLGAVIRCMDGARADVVYSDPPWGEGNLRYWRTHAGDATRPRWALFVAAWTASIAAVRAPGAPVFVEMGLQWADEFAAALERVGIVVARRWTVQYRSGARLLPNALLYAGAPLRADFDPSSLNARELPRACVAEVARPGGIVLDPCCGKGFTARAAVAAGMIFRGVELNPKRAEVTVKWLRKNRW
jgi:predicted RNA methylase